MAESHSLSYLKQRRADSLGELEQIRQSIADLEARETGVLDYLVHVDAILIHDHPEVALETIKPRKKRGPHTRSGSSGRDPSDKRLSVAKATLRVLRTGRRPMTVDEIVGRLSPDYSDFGDKKLKQNVRMTLSNCKRDGILAAVANDDGLLEYAIAG